MPIYEYDCRGCGHAFELLVSNGGKRAKCPQCNSTKLKRRFSVFAAHQGSSGAVSCAGGVCPAASRGGASPCASGHCPLSR
jgi:putative FmdB family regulatory protein